MLWNCFCTYSIICIFDGVVLLISNLELLLCNMDFLQWLFDLWYVLLICVVCLTIGFVEDLLHLEHILLGHVRGGYLGCDEHICLLDFSHFLLPLNELGHWSQIGCCLHN